jgi:GNAT superfamily N-acetyltransferase
LETTELHVEIQFHPVEFADVREAVRRHLAALPSAIDAWLEEHILTSNHYRIEVAGETAGFASIRGGSRITQFALAESYKRHGQLIFAQLRRMEQVQFAFVPTCDEFYLAHALDDYRLLAKHAYMFATPRDTAETVTPRMYTLRLAELSEAAFIRQEAGDLFDDVERRIEAGQLFATMRGEELVGFGILEQSSLYDDVASIGMHTIERFRRQGVGTTTISLLIDECRRRGLRPVAGCWYYNHFSKKTLERAGMYSATRLLKVDY